MNTDELATLENLEAVFKDIDVDGSGSISKDEIKRGLPLLANENDM